MIKLTMTVIERDSGSLTILIDPCRSSYQLSRFLQLGMGQVRPTGYGILDTINALPVVRRA